MQVEYSGTIPLPVDEAWTVLTDLERVAGCLPGVRLDQITDDEVVGTITVPLGPLRLTYRGEAAFIDLDPMARQVVIDARGRDSHGEQAASARITVQLRETGASTQVMALANVMVRGMSPPVGFAVREFGTGLLREFVLRLGAVRTVRQHQADEDGSPVAEPAGVAPSVHPDAEPASRAKASDTEPVAQATATKGEPPPRAKAGDAEPAPRPATATAPPPPSAAAVDAAQPDVPQPDLPQPDLPQPDLPQPEPQPRPQVSPAPPAPSPEDAVYPVPPPGVEAESSTAIGQLVPYAGALAVGVLLGWLAGRRRRRT